MDDNKKTDDSLINEEDAIKPAEHGLDTISSELLERSVAKDSETPDNHASVQAVNTAQQVDFLVKSLIAEQVDIREKLKEQRSMLKDTLESDATYRDLDEQIKTLTKRRKQIQQTLLDSEGTSHIKEEVQSLTTDLKGVEKKLTGYLEQYLSTYNTRTIEDRNGQLREIITQYKLVKKVV